MMLRALLILLLSVIGLSPLAAQMPSSPLSSAKLNVPAVLEAESATPAPGQSVTLALRFRPAPTWHGYWQNPGEAGFGMQLKWQLPKGVTAGEPRYPVPSPLMVQGLMNYVFERDYAVLVDVKIDASVAAGTPLPIKLRGDWLACTDEICVPEGDDLSITLRAGNSKDGNEVATHAAKFDQYRMALPVPLDRDARYAITGNAIEIAIDYPANAPLGEVYFFPLTEKLFRYSQPQSAKQVGDRLIIKAAVSRDFAEPITGLLRFGDAQGDVQGLYIRAIPNGKALDTAGAAATPVPIVGGQGAKPAQDAAPPMAFGWILLFAVLGGLILNLMPCVFPILGLKALALAKAGGNERTARRDALAYSAGVILSCVALGGVMLALRAAGQQVGWAFQLQDPAIVLCLALLMVAVTANLAGVFELSSVNSGDSLARQSGMMGSFWTGVLAAIVATPCTGPFMATAMGAALLLPTAPALLLFAGLGLGLALPFLAIAYMPALRQRMPKPGPWLSQFRRAMAIPMGLTAIALLWLLWRMSGGYGLMIGTLACVTLLITLVLSGKYSSLKWAGVLAASMVVGLTVVAGVSLRNAPVESRTATADMLKSEPFSQALLDRYRTERRPVFVYFTADWCVTCKVNEYSVLNTTATQTAFVRSSIVVLKGDFTRRDPAISRFLNGQGRSGVPLYLYYPADSEAQILPQILTRDVMNNLSK
jgi:thiol:disulfide interchange protein/DsbC/DsbD-like thiol-disulfide interchange protein